MQNNIQKIAAILTDELDYAYCDNCNNTNRPSLCESCHRKYQNWSLSHFTAKNLAEKIYKEVLKNAE